MTDTETILLVLAGIYLWECACTTPAGAICFSSSFDRLKPIGSVALRRADQGRLAMTSLPPLATSFVCQTWPLPLDAHGLVVPAEAPPDDPATADAGPWLALDEVRQAEARERALEIDGRSVAEFASPRAARLAAERVRRLAATPADEREAAVQSLLDEQFDTSQIAAKRATLRSATASLRTCCGMLGLAGFVVAPLVYLQTGSLFLGSGLVTLGFFATLWLAIVVQYYFARRKLLPESRWATCGHTLLLAVSPASAMRAAEALGRDLLAGHDPLAVAAVVCSAGDFRALAGARLRALRYPLADDCLDEASAAGQTQAWFSVENLRRLEGVIEAAGCDLAAFDDDPPRGHDALAYCPRCLTQYVFCAGTCPDCGRPVRAFARTGG